MSEKLALIDVNQLFRDAAEVSQCIDSFELTWEEKKDIIDITPYYSNTQQLGIGSNVYPVIKIKYFKNE